MKSILTVEDREDGRIALRLEHDPPDASGGTMASATAEALFMYATALLSENNHDTINEMLETMGLAEPVVVDSPVETAK